MWEWSQGSQDNFVYEQVEADKLSSKSELRKSFPPKKLFW